MTLYAFLLFLHFVGMIALFVGYGLEWIVSALLRRATTAEQARSWLRVYRTSLPISGPGLLLLILTGGYLATLTGGMKQGWISASLLGIVFALGIGFVFILPRVRAIRGVLPEGSAMLSVDALARVRNPLIPTLIRARAMLALGIVYLMTTKPPALSTSLAILGAAILLGVVFSAATWSRGSSKL
jgi:Predicted integral membrane protein (DUF2269)